MKNLLTARQIREADAHTIKYEPVTSVDLMERASSAFVDKFINLFPFNELSILICCGTGNNGGDGLAIARLLHERGYAKISIWIAKYNNTQTEDFQVNYHRLLNYPIEITEMLPEDDLPIIHDDMIIDALLGSGLNKPLSGEWRSLVNYINRCGKRVVAVDIPTGMPSEGNIDEIESAIQADEVISFQFPKLNFLFPESARFMKRFHIVDIGLNEDFISNLSSDFLEITAEDIIALLKVRRMFTHKGTYGHCLIIAGNDQTMGAALLCAEACLLTGSGLTSLCIPTTGFSALNTRLPEVMVIDRKQLIHLDVTKYNALAMGPGLGVEDDVKTYLRLLLLSDLPASVLDADALNVLANEAELLDKLKAGTILTPHMKEFDRLFGDSDNWWERVTKAKEYAYTKKVIIVLKNQFTFIALPNGKICVNFTGNPAMASGGMGDILTGILVSLLAQGYTPEDAAILGCFLHGRAGDLLAEDGMAVVPASKLIQKIPKVIGDFLYLKEKT